MRKLILAMAVFLSGITFAYADSCSIRGESETREILQKNGIYKTQTRTCCENKQWSEWNKGCDECGVNECFDNGICREEKSCTQTTETISCGILLKGRCGKDGVATRKRTVINNCGSCSYSDWGSWDTSNCNCRCAKDEIGVNTEGKIKCYKCYWKYESTLEAAQCPYPNLWDAPYYKAFLPLSVWENSLCTDGKAAGGLAASMVVQTKDKGCVRLVCGQNCTIRDL